jgi:ketosteroid isomerase-like protein
MNIKAFLSDWIALSNSYDTEAYLDKYLHNAELDDPSVGRKFVGHSGIREYYTSYFIGYNTQTTMLNLTSKDNTAYLEVAFTGTFPEGRIKGIFDFKFKDGK